MASPVLHIKDSYYFDVPKALWRSSRDSIEEFPDWWVRNDAEYQEWEAEHLYEPLVEVFGADVVPDEHVLIEEFQHWQHADDHANFAKPFDVFLEEDQQWFIERTAAPEQPAAKASAAAKSAYKKQVKANAANAEQWQEAQESVDVSADVYRQGPGHEWSAEKLADYNKALNGKILIPQPFAELRNAYEYESGFAISRYMILEVVAALVVIAMFSWLASKIRSSETPRGRMWNMLEVVLLYFRDNVARPAIDSHDHGHEANGHDAEYGGEGHGVPADHLGSEEVNLGGAHVGEEFDEAKHGQHEEHEGDKFVPLLWTFFSFILICNLFGLVPWLGSPTASFGCTIGLALVTFITGIGCGMLRFGPLGFFANQVPTMDLPFGLGFIIKPVIFAIELLGLLIKHVVLGIRLLANMVAGHLVILGILGLAFTVEAASSMSTGMWTLTAVIAVVGSTLFYCLELFVAFLQAYIFTFLSALFIGSAIHKH
jgi:F-type H+-transporting ATPase subunit a